MPEFVYSALNSKDWSAIGQMILAVGAVVAASWAAYTFWKSKRAEAARWMIELFRDFYRDEEMSAARELLEYDFDTVAAPVLELRVLDRDVSLSENERERLRGLDLVLNFLEQLLYLEDEGQLLDRDRRVFFEYWFDQLSQPDHAPLRRYLQNCGYERCSAFLGLEDGELFAAYGSLLTGQGGPAEAEARKHLVSLGPCRIPGQLYSRGEFPALVPSEESAVEGELFRVSDKAAFDLLDELEHYDPEDRAESLYRRRCVRLDHPGADAWLYYWNKPVDGLRLIPDGSWAKHWQTTT